METSHAESAKVISPPSPGTLPVKSRSMRKKVGSRSVAVNDTIWTDRVIGEDRRMPESGLPSAILSQSVQAPPSVLPLSTGAESMEPRLEASVMEPRVTMTKSSLLDLDLAGEAAALV